MKEVSNSTETSEDEELPEASPAAEALTEPVELLDAEGLVVEPELVTSLTMLGEVELSG